MITFNITLRNKHQIEQFKKDERFKNVQTVGKFAKFTIYEMIEYLNAKKVLMEEYNINTAGVSFE